MKRASHRPKKEEPIRAKKTDPPSAKSRQRIWVWRISALFLSPLLIFGVAELLLRVVGYGHDTSFFRRFTEGQRSYLGENENFSLRFFPPELARVPDPIVMSEHKAPDTCRIFIFGESAAMGDPQPAFGAGRFLEVLLAARFPGRKFEVVNLGITAINSHVILPVARDCISQQADYWIIFMGNNEMVGPFGAATIFGAKAPPLWLVRAGLALQRTRVGQLLAAAGRRITKGHNAPSAWSGMEMFQKNRVPPGDPHRERVYQNFRKNLEDIIEAGLDSKAELVLSTVAVNLGDCPPFASAAVTGATGATNGDAPAEQTSRLEAEGKFEEATKLLIAAASAQPSSADLQFRLASNLERLTNFVQAREHFQNACDLDVLPFRADSQINSAIRDSAKRFSARGVLLCDAEATLAKAVPGEIPGRQLFSDHVHFTVDGNYLLGRAWAEMVATKLPAKSETNHLDTWASREVCELALAYTDWERLHGLETTIQRMRQPPFNTQAGNQERLTNLESNRTELLSRMDQKDADKAAPIYQEAIRQRPADRFLHENFGEFLAAIGQPKKAEAEFQTVHSLVPHYALANFKLGEVFVQQGRLPEAEGEFEIVRDQLPYLSEARTELGRVLASEGKLDEALREHERALQLRPQKAECYYEVGKTLAALNRRQEAIGKLQAAVRIRPDYWEAHFGLGGQLALENRMAEARKEFEQVIELKPDFAAAHLNRGVALMKQQQYAEALLEFEQTSRLEPRNQAAAKYAEQARIALQRK